MRAATRVCIDLSASTVAPQLRQQRVSSFILRTRNSALRDHAAAVTAVELGWLPNSYTHNTPPRWARSFVSSAATYMPSTHVTTPLSSVRQRVNSACNTFVHTGGPTTHRMFSSSSQRSWVNGMYSVLNGLLPTNFHMSETRRHTTRRAFGTDNDAVGEGGGAATATPTSGGSGGSGGDSGLPPPTRHPLDLPPGTAVLVYTVERQFALIVPETEDGTGKIEFRFAIADTAGKAMRSLSQELGRPFGIYHLDGSPVRGQALIADIARTGFTMDDGTTKLQVDPVDFEGNLPKYDDGRVHLLSLMQKSAYMRVRKLLEADPRQNMPYQEALELCQDCGMSLDEGARLLGQLHDVGTILLFRNARNPQVRSTVFLKPEEVADSVFSEFGMQSPTQLFVQEQAKKKERQLKALRDRHQEMKTLQEVLASRANAAARAASWTGFCGLAGGVGFYWWLVYDYFSWDIMEPVTYFTGSFFVIVGFVWWIYSAQDFAYGNLRDVMYNRRLRKLHTKHGFDQNRFEHLSKLLQSVEAEARHLDMTGYNPALIASYLATNQNVADTLQEAEEIDDIGGGEDMKLAYDLLVHQQNQAKK